MDSTSKVPVTARVAAPPPEKFTVPPPVPVRPLIVSLLFPRLNCPLERIVTVLVSAIWLAAANCKISSVPVPSPTVTSPAIALTSAVLFSCKVPALMVVRPV